MKRPIIGIPGTSQAMQSGTSFGTPATIWKTVINDAYYQAVVRAGGLPLILPMIEDTKAQEQMLELCDGFLLPGGGDIDPVLFGENAMPQLGLIDEGADLFWIGIVRYARTHHLPILGICKGMQLVNVALGGSLYQDMSEKNKNHMIHRQNQSRSYLMHEVQFVKESRIAAILGTENIRTNTMHHQCIKSEGEGLQISARTEDGIPEAMEDGEGMILLVQWHPEELLTTEPRMLRLFQELVRRAEER